MEFQSVIQLRRTVRDFSDRPVAPELVEAAIGAAFTAPTYNHLREWDFLLVDDRSLRLALTRTEEMVESVSPELARQFEGHDPLAADMYLEAIPRQQRMILGAPGLAVVTYKPKTPVAEARRIYDLNCLASVWCCIENFLLALAEHQAFAVTFIPKDTAAVRTILGIPDDREVAAIIPFGYRAATVRDPRQKPIDLPGRIHRDRW